MHTPRLTFAARTALDMTNVQDADRKAFLGEVDKMGVKAANDNMPWGISGSVRAKEIKYVIITPGSDNPADQEIRALAEKHKIRVIA